MVAGTVLSLLPWQHWIARGWDFPRLQIAAFAAIPALVYGLYFAEQGWLDIVFYMAVAATVFWQLSQVLPYTPLWRKQVVDGPSERPMATLKMVVSNVQAENDKYDSWRRVVEAEDPDIILAVEVNENWRRVLEPLRQNYPHEIIQPQENYFGMALLSRLPLIEPRVRFIVHDDVPSIHTGVRLRSGETIHLVGVHPRPPEPIRGHSAHARNAELVVIGRKLDELRRPTIIAGDLNDVAWSYTTELFLRISGMLDPRIGRGMYNTYNANNPLFRFPLDHVFHSTDFRLVQLRRLGHVGSDHFPILIELSFEPRVRRSQNELEEDLDDEKKAQEMVDELEERSGRPVRSPKAHPDDLEEEV